VGFEQQMLAIGRTLVSRPSAFVLDTGSITLSGPADQLANDPCIRECLSWRLSR
jgi:ABC-type branched-subunit amino acid transport system ATPase component